MQETTTSIIQSELNRIEAEENVTALYACESGSRAWGFESVDSDYDVRFIYLRRTSCYLSLAKRSDVIERPIEGSLDLAGWDLPKALLLFGKSNPPLLEWIQSPIVYRSCSSLISKLQTLLPQYYSPVSCMYHYLHMAEGNVRDYLQGQEVRTKKYFYALRPVLACLWIERGLGPVPTEFCKLVGTVVDQAALRGEIDRLLELKKAGVELGKGPRNETISSFVEQQVMRLGAIKQNPPPFHDIAPLNDLFVEMLVEVNGSRIRADR